MATVVTSTSSATSAQDSTSKPRMRIRDVFPKMVLGRHPTGPLNSITDVPGVLVHTESIRIPNSEGVQAVNTGVTTILPREDWFERACHAGIYRFNGSGEMTGSHWIEESGLLRSPIAITGSFGVGAVYDGIYKYAIKRHADDKGLTDWFLTPVVAETYDGYLSNVAAMSVTPDVVERGIERASAERVPEGCTGGGTGMICAGFKAGTGSASRRIRTTDGRIYTVGALIQSNFGKNWDLRFGGVPVGRLLMDQTARKEHERNLRDPELTSSSSSSSSTPGTTKKVPGEPDKDGSIIVILATDAPLSPKQLTRLATRATVGIGRVGGWGSNTSGDIFLAFSNAPQIPGHQDMNWNPVVTTQEAIIDNSMNAFLESAADTVEESIYNSVTAAHDTEGPAGRKMDAMDLDKLRDLLERWHCTE